MEYKVVYALIILILLAHPTLAQDYDDSKSQNTTSTLLKSRNPSEPTTTTLSGRVRRLVVRNITTTTLTPSGETTPTTMSKLCGGTNIFCSVEYDSSAEGMPNCCTNETNPMCRGCLDYCILFCGRNGLGVSTCFADDEGKPRCTCTIGKPTCNKLPELPAEEKPPGYEAPQNSNTATYILVLAIIVVVVAGAITFTHRVG
ncbi:MAG: hypothetical protein V1744_02305 [Candidatus Altiarchaeota archaeon]